MRTAEERISCIVPAFNAGRFLEEALESIFRQSLQPYEIIVVDDGSTDATARVVKKYGDRVRYIHQANRGPAAARNRGIAAAQGELLAFLDADDLWHGEKLRAQMGRFQARPELEMCTTHVKNFWMAEIAHEEEQVQGTRHVQALPGFVCQTLLARKSLFERIGVFDETLRIAEDNEWFMRARRQHAVSEQLPDVLVFRRMHASNLSRTMYREGREDLLKVITAKLNGERGRKVVPSRGAD